MIGSGSEWFDYWGFTGVEHHDLLPSIISRAVKAGFYVVLLQPGTRWPACTATDMALKRGHICVGGLENTPGMRDSHEPLDWDTLEPQERVQKVRPMVTAAVQRVTERYGGTPNVAIDLMRGDWADRVVGPSGAEQIRLGLRGGILPVPPSVIGGAAVTVETMLSDFLR